MVVQQKPGHKTPKDYLDAATKWLIANNIVPRHRRVKRTYKGRLTDGREFTNIELAIGIAATCSAEFHGTAVAAEFNCHILGSPPQAVTRWVNELCEASGLTTKEHRRQIRRTQTRVSTAQFPDLLNKLRANREAANEVKTRPMTGPYQVNVWFIPE